MLARVIRFTVLFLLLLVMVPIARQKTRMLFVTSNSMTPIVHACDIVITIKKPLYHEGDIISFYSRNSKTITTHAIYKIHHETILTKGYANKLPDSTQIYPAQIIGKIILIIPFSILLPCNLS